MGFAGGYIQGGGHGPMATLHGMGADQALSFDVLTAAGDIVTANAETNKDLYWALRGGGPATFGVVLSVTVKTYDDQPTAATILNINTTHTNDSALFWQGFSAFHSLSNLYVDNGMFVYYELGELRLHVQPFVAPNMNAAKLKSTLAPLFKKLDALKIPYDTSTKEFKTFFDLYIDIFEDEPGGNNVQIGGRFFAKQDIDQYADKQVEALKVASNPPGFGPSFVVGHIVWPGYGAPNVDNAINPRWRNASTFGITIVPMATDASKEDKQKALDLITNVIDKGLTDASPKGGAYVNEVC